MFVLGEPEKAKLDEVKHECLVPRVRYKYHSLEMLRNLLMMVDENIEFSRTEERKMERNRWRTELWMPYDHLGIPFYDV